MPVCYLGCYIVCGGGLGRVTYQAQSQVLDEAIWFMEQRVVLLISSTGPVFIGYCSIITNLDTRRFTIEAERQPL